MADNGGLLEVRDLVAGYGRGPAILNGAGITVEEGRTHCIIGPNGAGKSTLLKVISGLLPARAGDVVFDGESIAGLRPDEILRRGICLVPQERALFPDMSVRENLRMGGYIITEKADLERRLDEVLEAFPVLRARGGQRARSLSGGEQQMLTMGRTLVLRPRIVMLDEPSLGLAPRIVSQIFDIIRLLKDKGITVIIVEQNAVVGLSNADLGCVLDLGRTMFEGPAEGILEDPRIRELYLGKRAGAA
jgi:branched-chain amino acid transport system ATP-binding protein